MSLFRKVAAGTWADERFQKLSDDGKLLWLYLLTGLEVTSLPGLIVAGRAHLSEVMGWDVGRIDSAFEEFAKTDKDGLPMAVADWKARVIWVPKAYKHNRPTNPKVIMGWKEHWSLVPECDLKIKATHALLEYAISLGIEYEKVFRSHILDINPHTNPPFVSHTNPYTKPDTNPHTNMRARVQAPAAPSTATASVSSGERVQGEGVTEESGVHCKPIEPTRPATMTPAPDQLEVPDELVAQCLIAGLPNPRDHVDAFLADARSKGKVLANWQEGLRKWVITERNFQRARPPPSGKRIVQGFDPDAPWLKAARDAS